MRVRVCVAGSRHTAVGKRGALKNAARSRTGKKHTKRRHMGDMVFDAGVCVLVRRALFVVRECG